MAFLDRVEKGVKQAKAAAELGDSWTLLLLRQQCVTQLTALKIVGSWLEEIVPAPAEGQVVVLNNKLKSTIGGVRPDRGELVYTYSEAGGDWAVVPPVEGVDPETRLYQFLASVPVQRLAKGLGDTAGRLIVEHNIPPENFAVLGGVSLP